MPGPTTRVAGCIEQPRSLVHGQPAILMIRLRGKGYRNSSGQLTICHQEFHSRGEDAQLTADGAGGEAPSFLILDAKGRGDLGYRVFLPERQQSLDSVSNSVGGNGQRRS
jgi:hypothetical protein